MMNAGAYLQNLWNQITSAQNFVLAAKGALRNKFSTSSVRRFIANRDAMTAAAREDVICGRFRTSEYVCKRIYEPKCRDIYVLPFYPDRIVHHALVNVLSPIWDKQFIRDSYACRKGRGIHAASRRIMEFVRKNRFCLQCDIAKFYPSINHDIMFGLVCKSLSATIYQRSPLLDLLHNIIYSIEGGVNMPIGNLTSQWFGNLYLNELDRFVKDKLRAVHYVRYCDDFVLFSDDKRQLRVWRDKIREFLADRLKLQFSYAEIFPVSNGVDFCGYRHFRHGVLLRRTTLKRLRRRIKHINRIPPDVRRNNARIRGQIASMRGWTKHCHTNLQIPKI